MTQERFLAIKHFAQNHAKDTAHDFEHVLRVLYQALDLARFEESVNMDVLICACLLHDIGRDAEKQNPALNHAEVSAELAAPFLLAMGYEQTFVDHVADCIRAHRFRKGRPHESIESVLLFDADKLEVAGALGVARTLQYAGEHRHPLYTFDENTAIHMGEQAQQASFVKEYVFKLSQVAARVNTVRAKEIANARFAACQAYHDALIQEISSVKQNGARLLEAHFTKV